MPAIATGPITYVEETAPAQEGGKPSRRFVTLEKGSYIPDDLLAQIKRSHRGALRHTPHSDHFCPATCTDESHAARAQQTEPAAAPQAERPQVIDEPHPSELPVDAEHNEEHH